MSQNRGAFYIPAADKNDTNIFHVPGELVGETPEGTDNTAQQSFEAELRQRTVGVSYWVHIVNGWDVDIDVVLRGSHFDDRAMDDAVIIEPESQVLSGDPCVFEGSTGATFMDVQVNGLGAAPSTGTLKVVFQARYR